MGRFDCITINKNYYSQQQMQCLDLNHPELTNLVSLKQTNKQTITPGYSSLSLSRIFSVLILITSNYLILSWYLRTVYRYTCNKTTCAIKSTLYTGIPVIKLPVRSSLHCIQIYL